MKRAEKEVLRAGLESYHIGAIARARMVLEDTRRTMHGLRSEEKLVYGVLSDWNSFYGLARAQVMVLRRAKLTLEAVSLQNRVDETLMAVFDDRNEEERAREHGRLAEIERGLRKAGEKQWNDAGRVINDNDPRWSAVNDDTQVRWIDENKSTYTTWGALDRNARKTVDMLPNGHLVGGFPF